VAGAAIFLQTDDIWQFALESLHKSYGRGRSPWSRERGRKALITAKIGFAFIQKDVCGGRFPRYEVFPMPFAVKSVGGLIDDEFSKR